MSPLEALSQLVARCEQLPMPGNEGLRAPLLAEAKAYLREAGIETSIPTPGSTYQGWLTFKDAPLCIVAEEKDRAKLTEAIGLLLRASHEAGYGDGPGSQGGGSGGL